LIQTNPAQDINEQRRLCYVAMTRAKKELFLCHSRRRSGPPAHGLNFYNTSRFIVNIPKKHKKIVTPRTLSS
jgi:DNA helicase-2/ATP-dependent DNA helicase PcrA